MTLPPLLSGCLARLPRPHWGWWWMAPLLAAALLLYYGVGGLVFYHIIDDDPHFSAQPLPPSQSRVLDVANRLILREVDQHQWVANDPFFKASYGLDDMPNYQRGIVAALQRSLDALSSVGRDGGEVRMVEVERAAGLLKYPGTIWKFDLSISWAPTASSEKQYRAAARNLDDYNRRLLAGSASLDRSPAPLLALLNAITADLGQTASLTGQYLAQSHWALLDSGSDDLYYDRKGRLYAYALLLRECGSDYAALLETRGLGDQWKNMVDSMIQAATPHPTIILNGSADSGFVPNHLAYQGFHLLLAHGQLLELSRLLAGS